MQAPRWLGECGNYLGGAQTVGITSLEEFSRRYNIPLSRETTTTYVPPPTTTPITREPTTRPTDTAVPVDATITTYVPPPATQPYVPPEYVPPEQAAPMPEPLWQTQMPVQYGGGAVQVVREEKEKLPGWVVPALIAAATMLMGGGS